MSSFQYKDASNNNRKAFLVISERCGRPILAYVLRYLLNTHS